MSGPRLTCLVGLPSTYLNNLEEKYDNGEIKDLLLFLHGGWAEALYHDQFPQLREILVKSTFDAEKESPESEIEIQHKVEEKLQNFLKDNLLELPAYQIA